MSTLHLFNPFHDEALAVHSPHYLPPLAARRLAVLLADLPRWWMQQGDECLSLPLSFQPEDCTSPRWDDLAQIQPWGWDWPTVQFLKRLGAPDRLLPSVEQLHALRELSSRHTTVQMLETLNGSAEIAGVLRAESRWCRSIEEVETAILAYEGLAMLKLPWSSSGRGVFSTRLGYDTPCRQRAERSLRRYGGIEVQRLALEGEDGALEFEVKADGTVHFWGCSLFHTTVGGAYLGHRVDTMERLEADFIAHWKQRCATASPEAFGQLVEELKQAIAQRIAPHYVGLLGIDVLFTPDGLHPCIEVNLRRTMGHVALDIAQRLPLKQLPSLLSIGGKGLQLRPA